MAKKMTPQVRKILRQIAAGKRPRDIAEEFGLAPQSVYNIKHRYKDRMSDVVSKQVTIIKRTKRAQVPTIAMPTDLVVPVQQRTGRSFWQRVQDFFA